jgi:hypothetical protein
MFVGPLLITVTRRRQRLGDLTASSIVVQDPTLRWARVAAGVVGLALVVGAVVAGYRMRGPVVPPSDMKGGQGCSTRPGLVQVAAVAWRHQQATGARSRVLASPAEVEP